MRIYTAAHPGWIGAEFFHSAPATSWAAASVSRLPLLALILLGAWKRRPALARIALVWCLAYLALGQWQRQLAVALGEELAAQRGHIPVRLEVKPSFGNILVWKVVYETATDFHVDAVRAWPSAVVYEGNSIPRLDLDRDLPWLARDRLWQRRDWPAHGQQGTQGPVHIGQRRVRRGAQCIGDFGKEAAGRRGGDDIEDRRVGVAGRPQGIDIGLGHAG